MLSEGWSISGTTATPIPNLVGAKEARRLPVGAAREGRYKAGTIDQVLENQTKKPGFVTHCNAPLLPDMASLHCAQLVLSRN